MARVPAAGPVAVGRAGPSGGALRDITCHSQTPGDPSPRDSADNLGLGHPVPRLLRSLLGTPRTNQPSSGKFRREVQAGSSGGKFRRWQRTEAKLAGRTWGLAKALEKLQMAQQVAPMDADPATAHLFIVNPLSGRALMNLFSTRPPLEGRIARLRPSRLSKS